MSVFTKDDYKKASVKFRTNQRKDQTIIQKKVKLPTQFKSDVVRFTKHCPRLCQQKGNGSYGKRTFDGVVCNACGYRK